MSKAKDHITVFEHASIRAGSGGCLTDAQLKALQTYFGKGIPYFQLIHRGVKFNQFVGVIQVGRTVIEVLPKADKYETDDAKWRKILIGMLKAVGSFDIQSTSSSHLKIKPNTILDLYFEQFIKEVEYLQKSGLIKKYRKKEGNQTALKGSLLFSKHIQQNLTHQERFFVRYSNYDVNHILHSILYKALRLLKRINTRPALLSRVGSLLLHFPEMPDIKVSDATFSKLVFNRKTLVYKKAIEIARLLLLQYHPDLSKGRNNVLALMFDMNNLWEKFVLASLRKNKIEGSKITDQTSKLFWQPHKGRNSKMRPDIFMEIGDERIVLDTKWKNLNGYNPSSSDLRQMYVYHEYYSAKKVALVYPGPSEESRGGKFFPIKDGPMDKECSIILLPVESDIKEWQRVIRERLYGWINP